MQLLDGGMFAFSAFHALKDRRALLPTWQGPLMVAKVVEDTGDGVAVCWNGERQWKRDRMPGYRPRPEIWQTATRRDFELMLRVLAGLGVLQFRTDEHEADEILAMLVHALEGEEPVLIRSDDKDFMQLLSPTTWMFGRVRGLVKPDDVPGVLGVRPGLVADLLALQGDAVDGIPRVASDARALRLLRDHGRISDWIASPIAREELGDGVDQLKLNLELTDLGRAAVGDRPPPPLADGYAARDFVQDTGELKAFPICRAPTSMGCSKRESLRRERCTSAGCSDAADRPGRPRL